MTTPAGREAAYLMAAKAKVVTEVLKDVTPERWLTEVLNVKAGLPMEDLRHRGDLISPVSLKANVFDLLGVLFKNDD